MTHAYGPHDPGTAPGTVTVGRGALERTVPLPAEVVAQRERINALAATAYPEGVPS